MVRESVTEGPGTRRELREDDLALVEALQVAPRAPWPAVAEALGSTPATLARRWRRLTESGVAWVAGPPGVAVWNAQCVAYVELSVVPGRNRAVADLIAADRHALSVELVAGGADVFVTVGAADLDALTTYLLDRLDRVPGVSSARTRIATRVHRDGSAWRLGALPPAAAEALAAHDEVAPAVPGPVVLQPGDRAILVELGRDGRASYPSLAQVAGVSEATARRRVARLRAAGAVLLRAELAARLAGWAVPVVLALDAPTAELPAVAEAIGQLRRGPAVRDARRQPAAARHRLAARPRRTARVRDDPGGGLALGAGGRAAGHAAHGEAHGPAARRRRVRRRCRPHGRVGAAGRI